MIRTAQFIYNIIGFSLLLVNDYILTVAGLEMVIVCGIRKNQFDLFLKKKIDF